MKEATESREKKCPVCKREYPEEDNYCGTDGSVLEQTVPQVVKHLSRSAGTPITTNPLNAEPDR